MSFEGDLNMTSPPDLEGDHRASDGTVEILYLLDRLEEMVGISKRVPFSHRVMVEEEQFVDLVEQLRIAIPNEVKQAQRVVRDRERIIAEAQQEASRITEASRARAEYLVSQEGILNEARQRSEEILRMAEERRKRQMGEIDVYAMEQFNRIEQALRDGLELIDNAVQETVAELQNARNSIGQ
jgi:F0F1-type ATP synthase membrane subunit b/b'